MHIREEWFVGETRSWQARIGELAVYPGQGVTRIEAVERKEIAGQGREFIVLRKVEDESRILVPRENASEVGLRPLSSAGECERVWEILGESAPRRRAGIAWSRQYREYQDTLREGSILAIAEILRDLMSLKRQKELSFGERRVLETARSLLVQELAAAESSQESSVIDRIEAEFGIASA
jgi:CarD family transcriptional regulator